MLERFKGPILIERTHFLIANGRLPLKERRECAARAIKYLLKLQYTKTPYWKLLLLSSELEHIGEMETIPTLDKKNMAICKAIAHEYTDAISLLESVHVPSTECYQKLEMVAQFLVLARNFKGLEELEYRITGTSASGLPELEAEALRRIQLLISCGFYMQGKYFDFCRSFFKLIENDSCILDTIMRDYDDQFITCDEIMHIVTVSAVVSIPFDNYDDFLRIEKLTSFREKCPKLVQCLKLLTNTSFGRFLRVWHGIIGENCHNSPLLIQGWDCARCMMRNKIYFFYLRISKKLEISYLSRTLNIEEPLVERELLHLVKSAHLNFEIIGDTISYKNEHYLKGVSVKLMENYETINQCTKFQSADNKRLRDTVQGMIIHNNRGTENNCETAPENVAEHTFRYNFDDDMDVDEINDISDDESASFIIAN